MTNVLIKEKTNELFAKIMSSPSTSYGFIEQTLYEIYNEGFKNGSENSIKLDSDAYKAGYEDGYNEGWNEGQFDGYDTGYEDGCEAVRG